MQLDIIHISDQNIDYLLMKNGLENPTTPG